MPRESRSPITDARLPHGPQIDSGSEIAAKIDFVDQDHRRARAQSEEHRRRNSARRFHLRHRRFRFRQIDADSRRALSESAARQRTVVRAGAGRVQIGHRRASDRRSRDGRSIAARAHAAFDADSLSRPVRSRPRTVRRATGSDGAGTDRERVFVQLRQRPLRTLFGHRFREDRDAIPERSLCALRGMRRQTFPAARPEGAACTANRFTTFSS